MRYRMVAGWVTDQAILVSAPAPDREKPDAAAYGLNVGGAAGGRAPVMYPAQAQRHVATTGTTVHDAIIDGVTTRGRLWWAPGLQ
jgi:hypothetical protein